MTTETKPPLGYSEAEYAHILAFATEHLIFRRDTDRFGDDRQWDGEDNFDLCIDVSEDSGLIECVELYRYENGMTCTSDCHVIDEKELPLLPIKPFGSK